MESIVGKGVSVRLGEDLQIDLFRREGARCIDIFIGEGGDGEHYVTAAISKKQAMALRSGIKALLSYEPRAS